MPESKLAGKMKKGISIMSKAQTLTFDEWFAELKRVAVAEFQFTEKSVETLCAADWKPYYDDGYTPFDTWREDFSYA